MRHILRGWHVDVNIQNQHDKNIVQFILLLHYGKIECISLLLDLGDY